MINKSMSTFINNKYYSIYYSIIQTAQSREIADTISEKHHILPRSLGGTDDDVNLVLLTPREHFICHKLLPKFTTGRNRYKMIRAHVLMSGNSKYSSRVYETFRKEFVKQRSLDMKGNKNPMFGADRSGHKNTFFGKKHSQETKDKISKSKKGVSIDIPAFTKEHKQNLSKAAKKNATKYKFEHKDGSIFIGSTGDLSRLVGSKTAESWKLVNGHYKTHKGWRYIEKM